MTERVYDTGPNRNSGASLIYNERWRHDSLGWTAEHDKGHAGELVRAADAYVQHSAMVIENPYQAPELLLHPLDFGVWPASWGRDTWKPEDVITNLVKAGALIAAAIDSILDEQAEGVELADGTVGFVVTDPETVEYPSQEGPSFDDLEIDPESQGRRLELHIDADLELGSKSIDQLGSAVNFLLKQGGSLVVAESRDGEWVSAMQFGREAEDSPTAAGAAYGMGSNAAEALNQVVTDSGASNA